MATQFGFGLGQRWRARVSTVAVGAMLATSVLALASAGHVEAASCPCSIWSDATVPAIPAFTDDTEPGELGVKFQSSEAGTITGIRFYKGATNTGTHTGSLWAADGTLLNTVTFSNETATGWQQALFSTPVTISANTTYIASYFAPNGNYAFESGGLTSAVTNPPLAALASGGAGGNGVFLQGVSGFPTDSFNAANYFVDVVFQSTAIDTTPPAVTTQNPAPNATGVNVASAVSATFSEAVNPASIAITLTPQGGSPVAASTSYAAGTNTVTLTPSAALSASTQYTVNVSGATDAAGNVMAPSSWSFTTAASSPAGNQYSIWSDATIPAVPSFTADSAQGELGVKFQASEAGFVTGIRFYKGATNTGTHIGNLWSANGTLLATVTFINETATGWQQALFSTPVAITPNTTYLASYFAPNGNYAYASGGLATAVTDGPLTALDSASSGGNGVFQHGPTGFPTDSAGAANYFVDLVFQTAAADTTPPTVSAQSPTANATGVSLTTTVTATFSEAVNPASIQISLTPAGGSPVVASTNYDAATRTITLTPTSPLAGSKLHTVNVSGAVDTAGNVMAPTAWTFTTVAATPPLPTEGPGGPIGVVTSSADAFSGYFAEIMRSEGLNEFATFDVSALNAAKLTGYRTVVLGRVTLTTQQVTDLTTWVTNGGNLIASRPDPKLASLLGLTAASGTLSDAYMLVDTTTEPGAGIVGQTMQFHGTADRYTLSGATAVAMLYSSASTATTNPAVTVRSVGSNGGQAAAFTYDLARSVVYTRQGNPAWEGQDRVNDFGDGVVRSNDMYEGGAQTDWLDHSKVAIPQADEQQRLLTNVIQTVNRDAFPLPRFWYFPQQFKAVVIATGDDHGNGGTSGRFNQFVASDTPGCSTANWECHRFTSYIYTSPTLSNSQAAAYQAQGFEVALHPQNGCTNYSSTQNLRSIYSSELADFAQTYPSVAAPTTGRFHCLVWSDWDSQPTVERENGIRFDVNYYYCCDSFVNNLPGFMTGSGMPQRFARKDGTMIDVYQAATQMTDESGQVYPFTVDTLLDRALGSEGYYGYFVANMHTDGAVTQPDTALLNSAIAHGVPIVSARDVLKFVDGRNQSAFGNLAYSNGNLTFNISVGTGATNLTAMLPVSGPGGRNLASLQRGATNVTYQVQTIKGVAYAMFAATAGSYTANYGLDTTAPTVTGRTPASGATGVATSTTATATFSEPVTASSIAITLTPQGGSAVAASTSYNSGTNTVTLTASAALNTGTLYTVNVSGARDAAGNTMSPTSWNFTTVAAPTCPCSIWTMSTTPGAQDNEAAALELGMKFQSSTAGFVSGVRFYKYAANTGTHVGNLWSASGTLLGSVTFSSESGSGWQQATFSSPIAILANTTYVISYHTNTGFYATTNNAFANGITNGPLTALSSGSSGGNGVYRAGASSLFPNQTFQATNYWVDVVYTTGAADTTAPTITGRTPASGATGVATSTTATATFSEPVNASSIAITLTPQGGSAVAATTSYNSGTNTVTLTPNAVLAANRLYTVNVSGAVDPAGNVMAPTSWTFTTAAADTTAPTVTGRTPASGATGVATSTTATATFSEPVTASSIVITLTPQGGSPVAATTSYDAATNTVTSTPSNPLNFATLYTVNVSGARDGSGNTMSPTSWTFTTVAAPACPCSIWTMSTTPGAQDSEAAALELGMKFQSSTAGFVSGVRFYKYAANTGTHVGNLWSASGTLLGSVTFNSETGSGWQQATFSSPIAILANTTYVISYHTNTGFYATTNNAFTNAITNGPLSALSSGSSGGNGVYRAGATSLFPNQTYLATNYWVDVVFTVGAADTTAPTVTGRTPASGATGVATSTTATATFSEAVTQASIAITLTPQGGSPVAATTSYNSGTNTVTLTPNAVLAANTLYTVNVSGAADPAGNVMAPTSWTFTTAAAADTTAPTVTGRTPASGATGVATSTTATATFSEPVTAASIVITLTPQGGSAVAATTSYNSGTNTVTLTPSAALNAGTLYTVNVSGARDAAGNTMSPTSWTFTTAAPAPQLYFSTLGTTNPPGVTGTADDADIYLWNGTAFSRFWDASVNGLATGANVDGYDRVSATQFYVSFSSDTTVPGLGTVQDEDVVFFNGSTWSVYFDGTARGLTDADEDIDAISIVGSVLYFSTLGATNPPGVSGTADDADVYSWNGTAFSRVWDASANGLATSANVDGLVVVDTTHFYVSFAGTTTVTGLGSVADVNIVFNNAGTWSTYFNGVANGLTSGSNQDIDAFDIA